MDAAILFSDIVSPLEAIVVELESRPGVGPVIAAPVRTAGDLRVLRDFEPDEDAPWLGEAVRLAVAELDVPLIGFAGGPFTLASYLIEGGASKAQARTKALMLSEPVTWRLLLERLCNIALASLRAQVHAGAGAVQVFDSWIGSLAPRQYELHVLPVVQRLFEGLAGLAAASLPSIVRWNEPWKPRKASCVAAAAASTLNATRRTPASRASRIRAGVVSAVAVGVSDTRRPRSIRVSASSVPNSRESRRGCASARQ